MRMFRLPSWILDSRGCDKDVNGEVALKMAEAARAVREMGLGGTPCRKRTVDDATVSSDQNALDAKRRKADLAPADMRESSALSDSGDEGSGKKAANEARIRDAIETQFSLEILLKHNELRLINQELAKCQVALEQLRRCHLIPYPQAQGTTESMFNISNGVGPAVGQGQQVPRWAPAYGVADGPYTRHYAKWLIPDPSFDGVEPGWSQRPEGSRGGKSIYDGRSTRHSFEGTPGSKARSQRGTAGQKLQALSSGYPQAKGKAGPSILRRGDGQMVKLVCLDCHREDFSSTQGFINHCRIAHRRDFKSHEEAAVASGQPVEVDELGGILGEEKSSAAATGLVHPLIKTAPTDKEAYRALLSRIHDSLALFEQGRLPGVTSIPSSSTLAPIPSTPLSAASHPTQSFVASSSTPHLSDLMRRRGFSGNLTTIVSDAQQHVDFADRIWEEEESDAGEGPVGQHPLAGLDGANSPRPQSRIPAMSHTVPGRPGSSKGVIDAANIRKPALGGISPRISNATPLVATPLSSQFSTVHHHFEHQHEPEVDTDMFESPVIIDLSPNTIASNNAPSLVSDDGEYDEGEDDAESATSGDDDEGSDVAEIDIEDDVMEKVGPRNRSGGGVEVRLKKEGKEKHVTFVSPVKETKERLRRQ